MVNKCFLLGRLGAKPERRSLNDGSAVCSFSLATSVRWKDKETQEFKERTDWHRISVMNSKTAEFCCDKLDKGCLIHVEGRLSVRKIDAEQSTTGKPITFVEVVIDRFSGSITLIQRPDDQRNRNDNNKSDDTSENEIPF